MFGFGSKEVSAFRYLSMSRDSVLQNASPSANRIAFDHESDQMIVDQAARSAYPGFRARLNLANVIFTGRKETENEVDRCKLE